MKKFAWPLLIFIPVALVAADTYFIRWKTDTQDSLNIKLYDNGDSTYSEAVAVITPELIGKTYAMHSTEFTTTGTLTFNGVGTSWGIEVDGGSATYKVNGSSSTVIRDLSSHNSKFEPYVTNPTIEITFLESGATAQAMIDGGV